MMSVFPFRVGGSSPIRVIGAAYRRTSHKPAPLPIDC
jgi:hypothetical protein